MGKTWMDDSEVYLKKENEKISSICFFSYRKIISEVIRIEYRPLRDSNPPQNQSIQVNIPLILSSVNSFA
jgi:hypothetical protein